MLFSYYYDVDKTHRLNCEFIVQDITKLPGGFMDIRFAAEIEEVQNGMRLKKESVIATFNFPPVNEEEEKHDIDFTRVRHGDTKKWIFTVINNKDTNQKAAVGLISETARRNPLGMDMYHNHEEMEVELKGNNLSILEQGYTPPVLTQTVASSTFSQVGYPQRFDSAHASYDELRLNYQVSEFRQSFLEPIPAGVPFKIEMDIAPMVVEPLNDFTVFDLNIQNLGRVSLLTRGLEYMLKDGYSTDVSRIFFEEIIQPEDFWTTRMTSKARLSIQGDGAGDLTVSYNGYTLNGKYDHTLTFNGMDFRGALAKTTSN